MQVPVLEYRFLLLETDKVRVLQSLICISVFFYCFPAYGNNISVQDLERIQKLQNTAIRPFVCFSRCCKYFVNGGSLQSPAMLLDLPLRPIDTGGIVVPFG